MLIPLLVILFVGFSQGSHSTSVTVSISGLGVPAFKYDLYVDSNTQSETADQDGSLDAPFATIQQALDKTQPASNTSDFHHVYIIRIKDGQYDENLLVNVTRRRIELLAEGQVSLGNFSGSSNLQTGGDVARNINVTSSDDFSGFARNAFLINSVCELCDGKTTNEAYLAKLRVSGSIYFTNSASSLEVMINGEVFGNVTFTDNGIYQLYTKYSRIRGTFLAPTNANWQKCLESRFDGASSTGQMGSFIACEFNSGFTLNSNSSSGNLKPDGFNMCELKGTFNGPGALRLDPYTNYVLFVNGVTVNAAIQHNWLLN